MTIERQRLEEIDLSEAADKNGIQEIAISYLRWLDRDVSRRHQEKREKERTIKQLRKIAKEGTLSNVVSSTIEASENGHAFCLDIPAHRGTGIRRTQVLSPQIFFPKSIQIAGSGFRSQKLLV